MGGEQIEGGCGCVETFCSALCRQAESWKVGGEGFALGRERGFQTIFLITPKKLSAVERLE